MSGVELPAWLAAGYGLVLLMAAYGIDRLAHRAHRANDQQQTRGFVYHEDHDAWICPEDQWLYAQSFDPDNRVMRYRGSPTVCNACPVKDSCTTSEDGRELGRAIDDWPASEAARFHRGIACAVTVLAVLFPLVSAFTVEGWTSQVTLLGAAVLIGLGSLPLWSHLRRSQVDPEGVLFRTLDENLADRDAVIDSARRRRTTYASQRQPARGTPVPLELGRTRYASDRREEPTDA